MAHETGVIRRVQVRLHLWRTMRSRYHEVREDSQHKNGGHTRYKNRAGPRQTLERQARQSEGHEPAFDCVSKMRS